MLLVLCTPMVVRAAVYQGSNSNPNINLSKYELHEEQNFEEEFIDGYRKGDVNQDGCLNEEDVNIILEICEELREVTDVYLKYGDMDNNGIINANDAALILDIYKYGN